MTKHKKRRPTVIDATGSEYAEWAQRATSGIDTSGMMLAVLDEPLLRTLGTGEDYWRLAVQIGHLLLSDKPLLIVVPHGFAVPPKLRRAATAVEFFMRDNEASFKEAMRLAFAAIDIHPKH